MRHQRRRPAPPDRADAHRGDGVAPGGDVRLPLPQRLGHGGGQLAGGGAPRRAPGAGMRQRLRRAHRERRPVLGHPQPGAEDGLRDHPRRADGEAHHRVAQRRRPRQPLPGARTRRTSGCPRSPTRRACTRRRWRGGPTPTSTFPRRRWATPPGWWCPSWPGGPPCSPRRAPRASTSPTTTPRRWSTASRSSNTSATSSRAPTGRSSCWFARHRGGSRTSSRWSPTRCSSSTATARCRRRPRSS